ncbi:glucoamylase family protein [Streptomyces sp. TR06-5]|uniref:glucoamylase family protein n=1 Tax=unclassified Streptomyces TaxID=2593676 RepID=UPI00399FA480
MHRRTLLGAAAGASAALALGATGAAARTAGAASGGVEAVLRGWFADTYRSLEAMVSPETGLPADNIALGDGAPQLSENTSSTNIGAWLWATVAAAGLGVIDGAEMHRRLDRAVATIERMQRVHGFWLNWYETHTGEVLEEWPGSGSPVTKLLSTVDNGWLDVGLRIAEDADPLVAGRIRRMRRDIDWSFFYAPYDADDPETHPGHMHTGFWVDDDALTPYFYGALCSETRISGYLGLGDGTVPGDHYWRMLRTLPPDREDQEMPPEGRWVTQDGVRRWAGHYTYRGRKHVPGWGGSMFEALMPELFVPSARWSPGSWGVSLRNHVLGQRDHGLHDAEYGYWGFSPSNVPEGGYQEYGVQYFGISNSGYCSNTDRTYVPYGSPSPEPSEYTNGVVTPHAAMLAMLMAPRDAMTNLRRLERDFDVYEEGYGFYDSVNVRTGTVSDRMLSLDQGMVAAALAQMLSPGLLQRPFRQGAFARNLRPLISREDFGV